MASSEMETVAQLAAPSRIVKQTNYLECILCQGKIIDKLVKNPKSSSYEKIIACISERAEYDKDYSEMLTRLKSATANTLSENKASWHRVCYQSATSAEKCKKAKLRYEKQLQTHLPGVSDTSIPEALPYTRSKSTPFDKNLCFFCETGSLYSNPLHKVCTNSAGEALQKAIHLTKNDKLLVKINTAIDVKDAHAVDIQYHKNCWNRDVTNVLRKLQIDSEIGLDQSINEASAEIEFLNFVELELLENKVLTVASLETVYQNIRTANSVCEKEFSRKRLKKLIFENIPQVEFHKPKRVNESERISIKITRDAAINLAKETGCNSKDDLKTLFEAAKIIRKKINNANKWNFTGSLADVKDDVVPKELTGFFRWIIQGTSSSVRNEHTTSEVNKRAMSLAQSTITLTLSSRQVNNAESKTFRCLNEMPQQLAIGLAVHQISRSKKIINFLHRFRVSCDYKRILNVENDIAQTVLERMEMNDGVYIPPHILEGRHIFFAVDNVDFAEDTPDGKRTLHATAATVYQKQTKMDPVSKIKIYPVDKERLLSKELTPLLPGKMPRNPKPASPVYPNFNLSSYSEFDYTSALKDISWLIGRSLIRQKIFDAMRSNESIRYNEIDPDPKRCDNIDSSNNGHIFTWSAMNSITTPQLQKTRVCMLPLIPASPNEWQTLLTVLMQAQKITAKIVGPNKKTVISLDMGLYKPAKQLQMTRNDLDHIILRPGELHIVITQLRTLGNYIDNSGIDQTWIEAGLYGPATVNQIREGNHVKRGVEAHTIMLEALFQLYAENLFKECADLHNVVVSKVENLNVACKDLDKPKIKKEIEDLNNTLLEYSLNEKMEKFDTEQGNKSPFFKVFRQYMHMVNEMLLFIRSVRTGDWKLHLKALGKFTKYFFAHDRLIYARMIPLYLAEMNALEKTDPEIYSEFMLGNWVVNKNETVAFCAIGADHALEQINRAMKVTGGLIGITLNEAARNKFFLISPELSHIVNEANEMADIRSRASRHHHQLTKSVNTRIEKSVVDVIKTIKSYINPFNQSGCELVNIVTNQIMSQEITKDMCAVSEIGGKALSQFISERINSSKINLWSPMKKLQLNTFAKANKSIKLKLGENVIQLKEDRSLFARLLIVSKSRADIDLKEVIGKYEFTVVPRSVFSVDGSLLPVTTKSDLMHILEKVPKEVNQEINPEQINEDQVNTSNEKNLLTAVVDAMAEVQGLAKSDGSLKNCSDLADLFILKLYQKYEVYNEVHVVFDRYDMPKSLKENTRRKRQHGTTPVAYNISDNMNISKIPIKRLLSHVSTKHKLTKYLAEKLLKHSLEAGKKYVVAWENKCASTYKSVEHLQSEQEEADTKLILHAIDASKAANRVDVYSPDTDVLVLLVRRYKDLCETTNFVTGIAEKVRSIPLKPIFEALGPARAAAIPGFHSFTGSDTTGRFSGKGKPTCWKVFAEADEDIVSAFSKLGNELLPSIEVLNGLEKFTCQLYVPGTKLSKVAEVRWLLFKRKQAQAESLPPTWDTLHQCILRSHYQCMIWENDKVANVNLPSPQGYGWNEEEFEWKPVMTTQHPAPDSILHLVKCCCSKRKCASNMCSCKKSGLNCTDLCSCSDVEDGCENTLKIDALNNEEEEEEDNLEF